MSFWLMGLLMISLHMAPNIAGAAWSVHQNGFHLDSVHHLKPVHQHVKHPRSK
jgi:hypothetical protein